MSIEYLDNNKCRLVVYQGSDAFGKPKRYKKTVTYTSKHNANQQYRQFEQEVLNQSVSRGAITLDILLNDVLESLKAKGRKPTTIYGYNANTKRILETLGNPKAKNVKPYDVELWVQKLINQGYAPKTIKSTVSFLSEAFEFGKKWGILTSNPCIDIELPKLKKTAEKTIIDESHISDYINAVNNCSNLDLKVVIELGLYLGLRRSEILGIRLEYIDTINSQLLIANTRHRVAGNGYEDETKTVRSTRLLAVPDFVMNDINKLIASHEQIADKLKMTDDERSSFLIQNGLGSPPSPNSVTKWVKVFNEKNGVPNVTLHGLRHSYASLLNKLGYALPEISQQIGHSVNGTTLNIYTHSFMASGVASKVIADGVSNFIKAETDI